MMTRKDSGAQMRATCEVSMLVISVEFLFLVTYFSVVVAAIWRRTAVCASYIDFRQIWLEVGSTNLRATMPTFAQPLPIPPQLRHNPHSTVHGTGSAPYGVLGLS